MDVGAEMFATQSIKLFKNKTNLKRLSVASLSTQEDLELQNLSYGVKEFKETL